MLHFHVICDEFSDGLTRRINEWLREMETKHGTVRFRLQRWQVSHNGELTYFTAEYTV